MIVEVAEIGTRPSLLTKARINAPQGAKALGQIFADQDWADKAIIVLDWQPVELAEGDRKDDAIIRVVVFRRRGGHLLTLEERFDVNDIFTLDQITRNDLIWIAEGFKKKAEYEVSRRTGE